MKAMDEKETPEAKYQKSIKQRGSSFWYRDISEIIHTIASPAITVSSQSLGAICVSVIRSKVLLQVQVSIGILMQFEPSYWVKIVPMNIVSVKRMLPIQP